MCDPSKGNHECSVLWLPQGCPGSLWGTFLLCSTVLLLHLRSPSCCKFWTLFSKSSALICQFVLIGQHCIVYWHLDDAVQRCLCTCTGASSGQVGWVGQTFAPLEDHYCQSRKDRTVLRAKKLSLQRLISKWSNRSKLSSISRGSNGA